MKLGLENKEQLPVVETVRGALFHRGKFLVLEKDVDSKNPGAIEFPGGKIDTIAGKVSTLDEQKQAIFDEISQETQVDVSNFPIKKVEEFEIYFEATGENGIKKQYKRRIHLFLIRIPDEMEMEIKVNQTMNDLGQSEDKHASYKWINQGELIESMTVLSENPTTGEKMYPLSRSSRHIRKLLDAVV